MDPQLSPALLWPGMAPGAPVRSVIAADVEDAEFGVQCFQTLPQPLCCLKSCRVLVAEIEMS